MGKTVVVGGGTAGLAAAFVLEQAGAECEVIEKRDFAGGRIATAFRDGFTLDLGAQFFFSRYPAMFDLMERLGASDELVVFRPWLAVPRAGKLHELSMDAGDNLRNPLAAWRAGKLVSVAGRLKMAKLAARLASLKGKLDFDDPYRAPELDAISFADYFREHFGEELLEYFAQPIASTLTLGMPEEISAAHGLALALYMPPGLFTFKKGTGFLADTISRRLRALRLQTEARRIVVEGGKVRGVEVSSGGSTETIDADHVICATPANLAAELLRDLPGLAGALGGVRYSSCAHVMFGLERRPFGKIFAIATPRREGFCFSGLTENSLKWEGYAPPGKGIVHVYTYDKYAREMLEMPEKEVVGAVTRELRKIEPSFPGGALFVRVFNWPEALCLAGPGHFAAMGGLRERVGESHGLHLAGEYLGVPSAEAAVYTGMKAAERVLAS